MSTEVERESLFGLIVEAAKTVALYESRETAGETLSATDYTFKHDAQGRLDNYAFEFECLVEEASLWKEGEPGCQPS